MTTWTKRTKPTTNWTKNTKPTSGGGSPMGLLLAITYTNNLGGTVWTPLTKPTTSWTIKPKAT